VFENPVLISLDSMFTKLDLVFETHDLGPESWDPEFEY
jgi:hypothetical protein